MTLKETLQEYFKNISDPAKKLLAYDTIDEYVFFVERIKELQKLPLIQIHPKNPELQKATTAGKQIKEYSQIVDAKRSTLLRILNQEESSAADELLAKLSEFE